MANKKNISLESGLNYDEKALLVNKRVISLRFRDYISQSGRRFNRKEAESALYKIMPILESFAKNHNGTLDEKYISKKQLDKIINKEFKTPTE